MKKIYSDQEIYDYLLARTIYYLNIKPRTGHEIRNYINQKQKKYYHKINPQITDKIIACLIESDYLNDEKFIGLWVSDRSYFKPKGKKILYLELQKKGIKKELIDEYFSNNQINEQELIEKMLINKIIPKDRLHRNKLIKSLLRRGFDYTAIKNAFEQLGKEE